jgi:hypothetical protein
MGSGEIDVLGLELRYCFWQLTDVCFGSLNINLCESLLKDFFTKRNSFLDVLYLNHYINVNGGIKYDF